MALSITNQTLTISLIEGAVTTVIRKDNLKVQAFGDVVRLTDYSGVIYEFLYTDCTSPSEASANDLRDAINVFLITATGGGGGSGTVTSVAATVPNPTNPAFSVAVPNPTSTPSIDITANGIVSQYIRGDGSLANFPLSGGGGSSLNYYLNGSVSQGTLGGVAFKQMSSTPVIGAGTNFSISSDGYIQSFITDASVPNQLAIPAGNWLFEMYFQANNNGGSPRFYIEIYKLSGGTLSLIASSVANPEFITNGTQVDLYTTAVAVPSTVLLVADRIAVRVYVIHSGRTITLHTENSNLCEVITTFSTGITALNGLTAQIQNFATGTSGTDFGITSVTDTHTFNLPTASATNRGALSSADWSTFNGKFDTPTGTTSEYIRGNGSLATFPSTPVSTGYLTQKNTFTSANVPTSLEYCVSENKVYCCNSGSNSVTIYNRTTSQLLATLAITSAQRAFYITSINEIWVSGGTSVTTITRINVSTNAIIATFSIGFVRQFFDMYEYSSTEIFFACADATNGAVVVVNPILFTITSTITISNMNGFTTGGNGGAFSLTYNNNPLSSQFDSIVVQGYNLGVAIINATTKAVVAIKANPSTIFLNASGGKIVYNSTKDTYYATDRVGNLIIELAVASSSTFTVANVNYFKRGGYWCFLDTVNNRLFVPIINGPTTFISVSVVDCSTNSILQTLPTDMQLGSATQIMKMGIDTVNKKFLIGSNTSGMIFSEFQYA